MKLKDRLKELRNLHSISASSLGKKLNKAESTVRMWEIGKAKPDLDTLIALSEMYNCSLEYLVGLTNIKNKDESNSVLTQFNKLADVINKHRADGKTKLIISHQHNQNSGSWVQISYQELPKMIDDIIEKLSGG